MIIVATDLASAEKRKTSSELRVALTPFPARYKDLAFSNTKYVMDGLDTSIMEARYPVQKPVIPFSR